MKRIWSKTFYIAATAEQQELAHRMRLDLELQGFKVNSRWHFVVLSIDRQGEDPQGMADMGTWDSEDVRNADEFVMRTDLPSLRGGRHVEMGIALALGKPIHLIGKREKNPFQYLPGIKQYDTWEDFLAQDHND